MKLLKKMFEKLKKRRILSHNLNLLYNIMNIYLDTRIIDLNSKDVKLLINGMIKQEENIEKSKYH